MIVSPIAEVPARYSSSFPRGDIAVIAYAVECVDSDFTQSSPCRRQSVIVTSVPCSKKYSCISVSLDHAARPSPKYPIAPNEDSASIAAEGSVESIEPSEDLERQATQEEVTITAPIPSQVSAFIRLAILRSMNREDNRRMAGLRVPAQNHRRVGSNLEGSWHRPLECPGNDCRDQASRRQLGSRKSRLPAYLRHCCDDPRFPCVYYTVHRPEHRHLRHCLSRGPADRSGHSWGGNSGRKCTHSSRQLCRKEFPRLRYRWRYRCNPLPQRLIHVRGTHLGHEMSRAPDKQ